MATVSRSSKKSGKAYCYFTFFYQITKKENEDNEIYILLFGNNLFCTLSAYSA
jgi:hypothetical protein